MLSSQKKVSQNVILNQLLLSSTLTVTWSLLCSWHVSLFYCKIFYLSLQQNPNITLLLFKFYFSGANLRPCINYVLSLPTELSSRIHFYLNLKTLLYVSLFYIEIFYLNVQKISVFFLWSNTTSLYI